MGGPKTEKLVKKSEMGDSKVGKIGDVGKLVKRIEMDATNTGKLVKKSEMNCPQAEH